MRQLIILFWFIPISLIAQESNGIQFEKNSGWQQILDKAKSEHRYIFVDCYATWCGPCKLMDDKTYPSKIVGEYINSRFISAKIQMDSTNNDTEQIKGLYAEARKLMQKYNIHSLPCFLFFSPDGKIVHRDIGYKNDSDFINLAMDALNPEKQVYSLLENYQQGKRNYLVMPYLSSAVSKFDNQLGNTIAEDYVKNYLLKLKYEELFTRQNIDFIVQSIRNDKSAGFAFVYRHSTQIDSIMWRDLAENTISFIIKKQEIDPILATNNKSDTKTIHWNKIANAIRRKYDQYYAGRTILDAKLQWYIGKKQWPDYCKVLIQRVDEYGPVGPGDVYFQFNADAWYMFLYSNDKNELLKALSWSDSSLRQVPPNVQCMDTRANVLYKLGRKDEAIELEQKALDIENQTAQQKGKSKGYFSDIFSTTLSKIKNGEPTW